MGQTKARLAEASPLRHLNPLPPWVYNYQGGFSPPRSRIKRRLEPVDAACSSGHATQRGAHGVISPSASASRPPPAEKSRHEKCHPTSRREAGAAVKPHGGEKTRPSCRPPRLTSGHASLGVVVFLDVRVSTGVRPAVWDGERQASPRPPGSFPRLIRVARGGWRAVREQRLGCRFVE